LEHRRDAGALRVRARGSARAQAGQADHGARGRGAHLGDHRTPGYARHRAREAGAYGARHWRVGGVGTFAAQIARLLGAEVTTGHTSIGLVSALAVELRRAAALVAAVGLPVPVTVTSLRWRRGCRDQMKRKTGVSR